MLLLTVGILCLSASHNLMPVHNFTDFLLSFLYVSKSAPAYSGHTVFECRGGIATGNQKSKLLME